MVSNAVMYVGLLYFFGFSIDTLKFMFLVPMLISAFVIDYRLQIIPNRLTLTIFETGLIFTFASVLINTNAGISIFMNNMLGMIVGGGIFLIITLIGGLIAGKDAMGFGDVKLMGALGLFFGWMNIIMVAVEFPERKYLILPFNFNYAVCHSKICNVFFVFPDCRIILPHMHRENKFCIGVFQHKINPECLIRSQPRIHRDKRKIDRLVRKLTDLVPESAFLFAVYKFSHMFHLPVV